MMLLVITICSALSCDRIVQPVESCSMSAFDAQVILAQTRLYDGTQHINIKCGKP